MSVKKWSIDSNPNENFEQSKIFLEFSLYFIFLAERHTYKETIVEFSKAIKENTELKKQISDLKATLAKTKKDAQDTEGCLQ